MTGADAIAILVLLTIVIAIGVYLLHWLYRHSSKDQSFVRTGVRGERVIMGGGAFVLPIIHDITLVNMNAVPIEIRRIHDQSLLTKNKMRIDVAAEFDIRVIPTEENISLAARTFGGRMFDPFAMKEIIQGRFIDAMAAVAATKTMEEIHSNRLDYIQEIKGLVEKSLTKNGLELENASLVSLNQSDISVFNPSNAFDAEGLTQLTEQVETGKRRRNEIENETRIGIKMRDYEAEQKAIEIDRDLEYARIEQTRDVERRKSQQQAEIAQDRASSDISIHTSKVNAEREAEIIRIAKDKAIQEEQINSENKIKILNIERMQENEMQDINSRKALEAQRIKNTQLIAAERIENERKTKELEIQSRRNVSIYETNAMAEIDTTKNEKNREVEESRIEATNAVEILSIEKAKSLRINTENAASEEERAFLVRRFEVDQERLQREEDIAKLEIDKNQSIKLAQTDAFQAIEHAGIQVEREVQQLRIAAEKFIDRFEIEQQRDVEIVNKDRLITVINKSIEEAVAKVNEARARKEFVQLDEEVESARALERAERAKNVEYLEASSKVDREVLSITSRAKAQRDAAEQSAQAEIAGANAAEIRYEKDADGTRKLNEAENMRNAESRRSAIYEHLVKTLPNIIRETVKPMENIDSIKILDVNGLPGINSPSEFAKNGGYDGGGDGTGAMGNMTDKVANSAMKYRTQVAFVDGLMKELGLPLDNLGSAGGMSFRNFGESGGKNASGGDS